jgi:hypothetical protein
MCLAFSFACSQQVIGIALIAGFVSWSVQAKTEATALMAAETEAAAQLNQ